MDYKDALYSPDVSWDELTQRFKVPEKLYKYQSFYKCDDKENPYWKRCMGGEFHLSLGCEFEDVNDCKPYFNKEDIVSEMEKELNKMSMEENIKEEIRSHTDKDITLECFDEIVSNYQENIRIGCFTDLAGNEKMWDKYANKKRGYCIEYDTSKCKLFTLSTLPILYSTEQYNMSCTFVNELILSAHMEEGLIEKSIDEFPVEYKQLAKTTYIPMFIKGEKWNFEREYRMFLLKHRNTREGMLKEEDYLDENKNIDLSSAINAIYLGEYFDENRNSKKILDDIKMIARSNNISLYRKVNVNGEIRNEEIV